MAGLEVREVDTGPVWDIAESISNLRSFFDGSDLREILDELQAKKVKNKRGRNTWQEEQSGGQGEPY
ncbi:MAG: hypothetical protein GOMPHAMPRED_005686 [Gomphillus americanus]|uniref:Uncharacterized protein n=1 Tax=Gomphillus americanus TaxID=1940652 RepID=A0A8H3IRG9_9LECA|nr:MAG: hypothetical protein GOMPHAMPRED_005686 [Gomphillus americanus]